MLKPVKINYDFSQILSADHMQHTGSCLCHMTHELADLYAPFGGLPPTYHDNNTTIHQLWWDNTQLDFADLGRQLGIEVVTVSSIMQPPGCSVPYHVDTFYQIKKRFPERTELKVRANMYLEDYKLGHFIQYVDENNNFNTSTNWKAGEGFMWDGEVAHLSANAGMENKYTLQISGFLL